jgi:hypothetical protein
MEIVGQTPARSVFLCLLTFAQDASPPDPGRFLHPSGGGKKTPRGEAA